MPIGILFLPDLNLICFSLQSFIFHIFMNVQITTKSPRNQRGQTFKSLWLFFFLTWKVMAVTLWKVED